MNIDQILAIAAIALITFAFLIQVHEADFINNNIDKYIPVALVLEIVLRLTISACLGFAAVECIKVIFQLS
jgi:hypothetical protein